jgi:hypothetical protein
VTGSCSVAQATLKFLILLPQPPKCWNYKHCHHIQVWFFVCWFLSIRWIEPPSLLCLNSSDTAQRDPR